MLMPENGRTIAVAGARVRIRRMEVVPNAEEIVETAKEESEAA